MHVQSSKTLSEVGSFFNQMQQIWIDESRATSYLGGGSPSRFLHVQEVVILFIWNVCVFKHADVFPFSENKTRKMEEGENLCAPCEICESTAAQKRN